MEKMSIKRLIMFDNLKEDLRTFYAHHNKSKMAFFYYPMATAIVLYRFSCFCYKFKLTRPLSYILVRINDLLHGIWIGPRVKAGPGLFLAHSRGLVVNPETILGKNVTILQGVTLGGPGIIIGDNVTISANATIISRRHKGTGLKVGNNVTIGAGAVVICDVNDGDTVVGNPARKIN